MTPRELRLQIQSELKDAGYYFGALDGDFGIKTYDALRALDLDENDKAPGDEPKATTSHRVKASSFADPADISGFRRCKARGNSDDYCFAYGDNGKGFGNLTDCTDESIPYVALPRDYWTERFGSASRAVGAKVLVTVGDKSVECILGDTLPWLRNIHNGAGIDLAPGAQKAFGLKPPFMTTATWEWA